MSNRFRCSGDDGRRPQLVEVRGGGGGGAKRHLRPFLFFGRPFCSFFVFFFFSPLWENRGSGVSHLLCVRVCGTHYSHFCRLSLDTDVHHTWLPLLRCLLPPPQQQRRRRRQYLVLEIRVTKSPGGHVQFRSLFFTAAHSKFICPAAVPPPPSNNSFFCYQKVHFQDTTTQKNKIGDGRSILALPGGGVRGGRGWHLFFVLKLMHSSSLRNLT